MENNYDKPRPVLLSDEEINSDLWEIFYSHRTCRYKYKIEVQIHPIPNSDEIMSCIGITIEIKNSADFEKVTVQQIPNRRINAGYDRASKKLSLMYDKADINNIIRFLANNNPIRITYGVFKAPNYKGKPYAAIELDNF